MSEASDVPFAGRRAASLETVPWHGRPGRRGPARSGTPLRTCFQCHKCSTGCPIGPEMDLLPSQVMRLVQLGAEAEVLESRGIWLCASCEACTTRCPMGIDVAAVMDALRMLAVERKASLPDSARQAFQPQLPGQRAPSRPRVRGRHDGHLQAPHRRPVSPTWTRCRKCWPRASWRSCPIAAEAPARSANCSAGPKKRRENREIRLLSRLQPGVDRVGLSTVPPGPSADALGIELEEIPDWVCCGSTPAHATNASLAVALPVFNLQKARRDGPSRAGGLCLVLRPAADGQPQGPQRPGRTRSGPSGSPESPTTAAWRSTTCSTCW